MCEFVDWKSIYKEQIGWDGKSNVSCFMADSMDAHEGDDTKPSMSVVPDSCGAVKCFTCGYKTSSFLGSLEDLWEVPFDKVCRIIYGKFISKIVEEDTVKLLHKKLMDDKELLDRVLGTLKFDEECAIKFRLGWSHRMQRLTVPVTNSFDMVVDLRCYDVFGQHKGSKKYAKVKSWKKGMGSPKVFPFRDCEIEVMVEGEKDCMMADMLGLPSVTITAGAEALPDERYLKMRFEGKTVIVVPDNDAAGENGAKIRVAALRKAGAKAKLLRLPLEKKKEDFWDWVVHYGGTKKEFWRLTEQAADDDDGCCSGEDISNVSMFNMKSVFSGVSKVVKSDIGMAQEVMNELMDNGWFYKSGSDVYYATDTSCVPVTRRNPDFRSLMAAIDPHINKETQVGKVVLEHIENSSRLLAKEVTSGNRYFFSVRSQKLYCKADDSVEKILEVSSKGIREVRNGSNDDDLLLVSDGRVNSGFKFKKCDWRKAIKWAWKEIFSFIPAPEYQRLMIMVWFLSGFFKQITSDRPILRVMAPSTLGKSHALRLMSELFYGATLVDGPNSTVASMMTNSVRKPLMMIDNIELEHMVKKPDMNDLFVSLATNMPKEKRMIGTDSGVILERPDCITATTGIEPFDKHEIVNRFLYSFVDRHKFGREDYFEHVRFRKINESRDFVLSGILMACAQLVGGLDGAIQTKAVDYAKRYSFLRYPVYLAMMEVWCEFIEEGVGLTQGVGTKEVMSMIMEYQLEQMRVHNEGGNPVLSWLESWWVRSCGNPPSFLDGIYKPLVDNGEYSWWLTPTELFNELSMLAGHLRRRLPWYNAHQLGCRMSEAVDILASNGWVVGKYRSNGRTMLALKKKGKLPTNSAPADAKIFVESMQSMDSSEEKKRIKVRGRKRPA